jgi:hypothetical protein
MSSLDFHVGDFALTPDDDIVTVVHLAPDGTVAVESPWSAEWVRYASSELRHPDDGS